MILRSHLKTRFNGVISHTVVKRCGGRSGSGVVGVDSLWGSVLCSHCEFLAEWLSWVELYRAGTNWTCLKLWESRKKWKNMEKKTTHEHSRNAGRFDGSLGLFIQASPYDAHHTKKRLLTLNQPCPRSVCWWKVKVQAAGTSPLNQNTRLGLQYPSVPICQPCNAEGMKGAILLPQSTWESARVNLNPARKSKTQTMHTMRHPVDPRKTGYEWQKQWLETVWWNCCPISPIIHTLGANA